MASTAWERLNQKQGQHDARDSAARKKSLGNLADLLERHGITIDDVGHVQKVNIWQGFHPVYEVCANCDKGLVDKKKCPACGGSGKVRSGYETIDLTGIQFDPSWKEGPKWPVIQPARAYSVRVPASGWKAPRDETLKRCAILPDIQVGYWRDREDILHPTHDEAALDLTLQIVRAIDPELIVLVGDNIDFPELGRYRLHPTLARTTQASLNRSSLFASTLRAAAPRAEIHWLAGNHEERLASYIIDNAKAAFNMRRGLDFSGVPVLSIPNLCCLSSNDIIWHPGYPANAHWINKRLRVIHGDKVNAAGSTAHKYLNSERVSTIFGHVHRREWAEKTAVSEEGERRTILSASPGCLCRTDGVVPGHGSGYDDDGMPVVGHTAPNWQQGMAVVYYQEGDCPFRYEQIAFHDDEALWSGRWFRASVDVEGYLPDGSPSYLFQALRLRPKERRPEAKSA